MTISLAAYTIVSTTLTGALAIAAFSRTAPNPHFKEIDVERINIVEKDGRLRLTLSNAERSPGWYNHGKLVPGRPKEAGMIFFNDEGDENGGLIFGGKKTGDTVMSYGHMSFDQYNQDQDMSLDYNEENGKTYEGLLFTDRPHRDMWADVAKYRALDSMPAGPAKDSLKAAVFAGTANRAFIGKTRQRTAMVELSDASNHPRLRLSVDSAGVATIEFLDTAGKVTRKIMGTE